MDAIGWAVRRRRGFMMEIEITCPACGFDDFDLCRYESMMVLSSRSALFGLRCPKCGTKISTVNAIPEMLRSEVEYVALQLDCGMGRETPSR